MSQHDPICLDGMDDFDREYVTRRIPANKCDLCRVIAKARADEREQVAKRVLETSIAAYVPLPDIIFGAIRGYVGGEQE